MDEQDEGGSASQRSRIPRAVLVSKTKIKNEDSDNNASNDQGATPVVKVSSQIGQGHAAVSKPRYQLPGPINLQAKQKLRNGVYRQYVVIESTAPFSIQTMMNIDEGPMAGYEAIIVKPSKTFRFLELPRELRDRIYSLAMCSDESESDRHYGKEVGSQTGCGEREFVSFHHTKVPTPGLILVNRQVHAEAMPIMYGQSGFALSAHKLELFLKTIGRAARFVHALVISYTYTPAFYRYAGLLSKLVHLRSLDLQLGHSRYVDYKPREAAEEVYNIATSWIHAIGHANNDKYAAADIIVSKWNKPEWNAEFRSELRLYIQNRSGVSFPFLKLPRSVRLEVYELAMTDQCGWVADDLGSVTELQSGLVAFEQTRLKDGVRLVDRQIYGIDGEHQRNESLTPGLLRVCRSVHLESLPVLYSKNTFFFHTHMDHDIDAINDMLETFFDQIGDSAVHIRRFGMESYIPGSKYVRRLIHLRKLYVPLSEHLYHMESPLDAARNFYAMERQWIEGASSFRRDRRAPLRILSPTTGAAMVIMPRSSGHDTSTWHREFRAELKRLLLLN